MTKRPHILFAIGPLSVGIGFLVASSTAAPALAKTAGPPKPWADMTYDEKKKYMKKAVVPEMKPLFQSFDAKKFKSFTCESCHGKDDIERKYKMPSNDIHALPNTPEDFQAMMKKEADWPKWTDFMVKKVEPAMGKLLDVTLFDPKAPDEKAFGCKNCHKLETMK